MSSEGFGCFGDDLDCILGIRDDICANLAEVAIIKRVWSGERVGDGNFTEEKTPLKPTPQIVDYSHDVRVSAAGAYKQGDLILKGINKAKWTEEQLLTTTDADNLEEFIEVGKHRYRTIHIKEKILTWDIHIRKVSEDETERS